MGLVVAAATGATLGACDAADTGGRPEPFEVEPTSSGTGGGGVAYPLGPFGTTVGQVVADYTFDGFPGPDASRAQLVTMRLSDFYNPSGDEVFPEGSPYGAGQPKPRALGIVVGAVWCGPCQQEARNVLPEKHAILTPLGGQFLFVLADASEPGVQATKDDLVRWTDTFDTDFPAGLDTAYALGGVIKADQYPANILIDTREMTIVEVVSGIPPELYWSTFEDLARND